MPRRPACTNGVPRSRAFASAKTAPAGLGTATHHSTQTQACARLARRHKGRPTNEIGRATPAQTAAQKAASPPGWPVAELPETEATRDSRAGPAGALVGQLNSATNSSRHTTNTAVGGLSTFQ